MLNLQTTAQYRRDRRLAVKRGFEMWRLDEVVQTLLEEKQLAPQYLDHALIGGYSGFRECHIQANWLLIYAIDSENLILIVSRTGTHSDLFGN